VPIDYSIVVMLCSAECRPQWCRHTVYPTSSCHCILSPYPVNMADAEVRVEIVKPLKVFVFVADLNICNFLIEENSRDGNRGSYQCGLGAPP